MAPIRAAKHHRTAKSGPAAKRQVSWLAAQCVWPAFPENPVASWAKRSPLTVTRSHGIFPRFPIIRSLTPCSAGFGGDTAEVLQKRVMEQAEWKLLPRATELVCRAITEKEN